MIKILRLIIPFILIISCKKNVRSELEVYTNDFESSNLSDIKNGSISQYNGSAVLGQYNNNYFALKINNLPRHDLITITFDLYIHDRWDGNELSPSGPDIWEMLVDGNSYINTTFSNLPCRSGPGIFCPPQAYPSDYPNNNHNPKAGASNTNLPGACSMKNDPNGTTMYKIEKTFRHSNKTLLLQCLDKLVQTNTVDPNCDESWSVDNIKIKAISL